MISRITKYTLLTFFIMLSSFMAQGANLAVPQNLKCNYLVNPMGIGKKTPGLSWQIATSENNWLQSAYQILVSTNPDLLTEDKCNVWNSGKIAKGESVCIPYQGDALQSKKRYYWKVKVWDTAGNASQWSDVAFWETGLLDAKDWSAKWIFNPNSTQQKDKENIRWIWLPDQDALNVPSKTKAWFRLKVNLDKVPLIASLHTVARGDYQLYVNGKFVVQKTKAWQAFECQYITGFLKPGENTIEVKVSAVRTASFAPATGKALPGNYAAFAALLKLEDGSGKETVYTTSGNLWEARNDSEKEWKPAKEAGLLNDPKLGLDPGPLTESASLFRKEFSIKKKIASARMYVSALGGYEAYLNGKRVGENVLTPEYTNYNTRITYQTYDITALLKNGKNAVGALLGDSWYGSPMGWNGEYDLFDSFTNKFLAEIHVTYTDGTSEKIITDNSWKMNRAPVLMSEMYAGEFYDARLEQKGWSATGFNEKKWSAVGETDVKYNLLSPQINNPVRVTLTVNPVEIHKTGTDSWLVDMGQNLVGWAKVKVKGQSGTVLRMRFAERLKNQDSIYMDNLRNASATDNFVLAGKGDEIFKPHFCFHGFRYIEVSGYPGTLIKEAIVAEVISSVNEITGRISTSSELINKMYSMGIWGQRGNFISVPTDCPQRDERMGYTGDGQVFWRTGTYNFDIAAFTHKWMNDIKDEQTVDGGFTNTAPAVPKNNRKNGSPGWEDAGVIVPWSSWMQYGDKSIVLENWQSMERYMNYVAAKSDKFIRPGGYLGDWLAPDGSTNNDLIATGLWSMSANMMSQMATAIGKDAESIKYAELRENIKTAFQKNYLKTDGTVGTGSQTSYVIALHTGMVPDSLKNLVTEKLVRAIEVANWHLTTGFLGTPYLLFALSDNGRTDVAYRLLMNETYPSWGYMVKNGATTWWERWNSDKSDPTMNSFNHYAFGSVVEWMYRSMAGINTTPEAPGFKKIIIRPNFDESGKITHSKCHYTSMYGEITSQWTVVSDKKVQLKITVPANTSASVQLPANALIADENIARTKNGNTLELGSGTYELNVLLQK